MNICSQCSTQHDPFIFTQLNGEHSELLAELEAQCFQRSWDADAFHRALSGSFFNAYGMIYPEGNLATYITFQTVLDEAEVLNFGTVPALRNRGLGMHLFSQSIRELENHGIRKIHLEVRRSNHRAIHIYETCKFIREGLRIGYYADTGEDALLYARTAG
ncbi:MAG: ribosomal protein S18-alanine N-acetyltransferase [Desulfovibrionaceae bacterium]|nr:ribosomal protein S18-alanine N-acetyltransferase [Desulfovibrionaceae bacterium]